MNVRTGQVTPVTSALPPELDGPAMEIRSARLWSDPVLRPELAVIHTSTSNGVITIDPFRYRPRPQLNALLRAPDPVLLRVTSTSPDFESERFCRDLRRTLSLVNSVPSNRVFVRQQPLRYSRSSDLLNAWEPAAVV